MARLEHQTYTKSMSPHSVERLIFASCLRKQNLSEEVANKVIDRAAKEGLLLFYYKCELCNSFHMTKKEPGSYQHKLEIA